MDASCSAYQIMACLLLDIDMAKKTNLLNDDIRVDLYMILKEQFLSEGDNQKSDKKRNNKRIKGIKPFSLF